VDHAQAVPRPAKPARQTFRSVSAYPETTRVPGAQADRPRPSVLPRRLRRPRHGLRTIHRTLQARFRSDPRQGSRVGL